MTRAIEWNLREVENLHLVNSNGRRARAGNIFILAVVAVLLGGAQRFHAAEDPAARAEAERFFENEIRPLLAEKCFKCHAGKRHKGGLLVDSLGALLQGGDTGPAIVPGKPAEGLLIRAVGYADRHLGPEHPRARYAASPTP